MNQWDRSPVASSSFSTDSPTRRPRASSPRCRNDDDDAFEIVLPPSAKFYGRRTSPLDRAPSPLTTGSTIGTIGSGRGRTLGRTQELDHLSSSSRRSASVTSERFRVESPYTSNTSDVGYSTDVHQCLYYVYGFLVPRSPTSLSTPPPSLPAQPVSSPPVSPSRAEGTTAGASPTPSGLSVEQCLQILGFSQAVGACPTPNVDKNAMMSFFSRISNKQLPGFLSDLTEGGPFSLSTRFNFHSDMLRIPYTPSTGYIPENQQCYMHVITSLQEESCPWLIATPSAPAAMYICRLVAQKARVMNVIEIAQQLVYRAIPFRTLSIVSNDRVPSSVGRPLTAADTTQAIFPLSVHSLAPVSPHQHPHPHPAAVHHPIPPQPPPVPPPSRPLSSSSITSAIIPGVTTGTSLPPNYRFTVEDFDAAMQRAQRVVSQPRGRAALLAGGIISRIAKHCLGHANMDAVCKGPAPEGMALMQRGQTGVSSPGTSFIHPHQQQQQSGGGSGSGGAGTATHGVLVLPCPDRPGYSFWDDDLTEEEVATIVGTYRVSTGGGGGAGAGTGAGTGARSTGAEGASVGSGGQVAIRSWFPSPVLWHNMRACDLYFLEWTQEAEVFFAGRLDEIRVRGGQPLTQTEWRKRLHRFSPARNVHAAMDGFAREFVGTHCQRYTAGSS